MSRPLSDPACKSELQSSIDTHANSQGRTQLPFNTEESLFAAALDRTEPDGERDEHAKREFGVEPIAFRDTTDLVSVGAARSRGARTASSRR